MAKNPCSKKRTPETAYEVWEDASGTWKWFILKKYQNPEHEALNPFSRYYCAVQSPATNGRYEFGDVYATTVKNGNHLIANPLVPSTEREKPMDDWTKPFPVVTLRRYDLKQTGLTDAQIEALTDKDMEEIAEKMDCFIEDYYFDKEVWEHVFCTATTRLEFGNMAT